MMVSYVCPGFIMGSTFSSSLTRQSISTGEGMENALCNTGAISSSFSMRSPVAPKLSANFT